MTLTSLRYLKNAGHYQNKNEFWICLIIGAIVVLGVFCILYYLLKIQIYNTNVAWIILGLILMVIQLLYVISIKNIPIWDSLSVINEAQKMLGMENAKISSVNGYFEMYGNNYFIVIFLYLFYSILAFFEIEHYWIFSIILNIFCIDGCIAVLCYLAKVIKGKKFAFILLFLFAINPYTYIYTIFVYTNTISELFNAIQILLAYSIYKSITCEDNKKLVIYSVLEGIVALLSFYLRATSFIIIIAVAMSLFLLIMNKGVNYIKLNKCVVSIAIIGACFIFTAIGYSKIESLYVDQSLKDKNFPMSHWVMMSFNSDSRGMYSQIDEKAIAECETKGEKNKWALNKLKDRIQNMGTKGLLERFMEKISVTWSEGLSYMYHLLASNQEYGITYKWLAGNNSSLFSIYYQLMLIVCYFACFIGCIKQIHSFKIDFFHQSISLVLLGAFIFYLIWEANPFYNICFMPLVTFIMVYGVDASNYTINYRLAGVFILLVGIAGVIVKDFNKAPLFQLDNYVVSTSHPRYYLKASIGDLSPTKSELKQSFRVKRGKSFNRIQFMLKSINDVVNAGYTIKLYNQDDKLLYESILYNEYPVGTEYYHTILLPDTYLEGSYYFKIESNQQNGLDTIGFMYLDLEKIDYNPSGTLYKDGINLKQDLILNVFVE